MLVADPGANKLFTAAFTCTRKPRLRLSFETTIPARKPVLTACAADLIQRENAGERGGRGQLQPSRLLWFGRIGIR